MSDAPQSLLHPVRCPACGRPGRELFPCPWCGERAPLASRTRGDLALIATGWVVLAAGAMEGTAAVIAKGPAVLAGAANPAASAGMTATAVAAAIALLSGFFLAVSKPPSERGGAPEGRGGVFRAETGSAQCAARSTPPGASRHPPLGGGQNVASLRRGTFSEWASGKAEWGSLSAALLTALLALVLRFFAVPYPLAAAVRYAWLFPALAAAAFALRVPAEAPNAAASGGPARGRALLRHAPDLVAALSFLPFAAVFAACGPSLLSLAGFPLVLGAWLSRLASPTVPLLLSAVFLALLLPDPAFLAFGLLARTLGRPRGR